MNININTSDYNSWKMVQLSLKIQTQVALTALLLLNQTDYLATQVVDDHISVPMIVVYNTRVVLKVNL